MLTLMFTCIHVTNMKINVFDIEYGINHFTNETRYKRKYSRVIELILLNIGTSWP